MFSKFSIKYFVYYPFYLIERFIVTLISSSFIAVFNTVIMSERIAFLSLSESKIIVSKILWPIADVMALKCVLF